MNKKAQQNSSIFTILFIIVIFLIVFGGGLSIIISTMIPIAVTNGSLSGLEAFLISNLALWFILAFVIAILWWSKG